MIDNQYALLYCATQIPTLKILNVTGNPFSITGIQANVGILERTFNQNGGHLINETLSGPAYLKRGPKKAFSPNNAPLMITMGPQGTTSSATVEHPVILAKAE